MAQQLTHVDDHGRVGMVDVGLKQESQRRAVVRSVVRLSQETMKLLLKQALPKGDVLVTAKLAGIMAAKKTSELIPLCHPIFLSHVDVRFKVKESENRIVVEAEARTTSSTGVEMEALVAAQTACMTIYDMCKAVQRDIVLEDCRLVYKSGGQSGTFKA